MTEHWNRFAAAMISSSVPHSPFCCVFCTCGKIILPFVFYRFMVCEKCKEDRQQNTKIGNGTWWDAAWRQLQISRCPGWWPDALTQVVIDTSDRSLMAVPSLGQEISCFTVTTPLRDRGEIADTKRVIPEVLWPSDMRPTSFSAVYKNFKWVTLRHSVKAFADIALSWREYVSSRRLPHSGPRLHGVQGWPAPLTLPCSCGGASRTSVPPGWCWQNNPVWLNTASLHCLNDQRLKVVYIRLSATGGRQQVTWYDKTEEMTKRRKTRSVPQHTSSEIQQVMEYCTWNATWVLHPHHFI